MSETPATYTSLPEDLELLPTGRAGRPVDTLCMVHIGRSHISLNPPAQEALGKPERIDFLFGQQSRMLAIQPTTEGGRKIQTSPRGAFFIHSATQILRQLNLPLSSLHPGQSFIFTARLVEGALLIGPLPKGEVSRD